MHQLKTIKKRDLGTLHRHYLHFAPYSDFNVVSLWGYMVPGARFIKLGNAVAYEMIDYNTGDVFMSVMGGTDSKNLVSQLAHKNNGALELFGVPETTMAILKSWNAVVNVTEDIDNHDYVFSTEKICKIKETGMRDKRKILNRLERKHPNIEIRQIDQNDPAARRKIYSLFRRWIRQSGSSSWEREFRALKREIKISGFELVIIGAFDGNKLIGFTVNEIEKNGYYQGHFGKADYNYPGLGLFLEVETAKYIRKRYGCELMNLQQDMGIEGIRYYKQSLQPVSKLKKYNLTIRIPDAE